jgi:pyruvate formate lyase activating enzyme
LTELFETAKKEGINTCLDTSGIVFDSKNEKRLAMIDRLIKSCDLVMLDIKHINCSEHTALTGAGNENVLEFLRYLDKNGVKIRLRQVIVPGLTDKEEQLEGLAELAKEIKGLEKIELLPYHDMGRAKYEALGILYPLENTPVADSALLQKCYEVINKRL